MNEQQSSSSATATSTAPVTKTIKVITTRGDTKKKIQFSGTTWKELRATLEREGYDLKNTKAVESINKHTLEHDDAAVPNQDFSLFLMPYKSKSGGEVRQQVKAHFNTNKEAAKAHFGNYTQKSESDLQQLLSSYKGATASASSSKSAGKTKSAGSKMTSSKVKAPIGKIMVGMVKLVLDDVSKAILSLSDIVDSIILANVDLTKTNETLAAESAELVADNMELQTKLDSIQNDISSLFEGSSRKEAKKAPKEKAKAEKKEKVKSEAKDKPERTKAVPKAKEEKATPPAQEANNSNSNSNDDDDEDVKDMMAGFSRGLH